MAHVAFVSYSKNDKETVDAICNALEENGLDCWYAPRNVPVGADWDASILEALAASRVMILVWSSHSDQSRQVKREVALALDEIGVTVIPFRTERIEPSKLRYYLSGIQWFDASTPSLEANLGRLVEQVKIAIPVEGQLWLSEQDELEFRRTATESETQSESAANELGRRTRATKQANDKEENRLLSEVEALQAAEAEALEEAEAAAFRQNRLRAEVAALQRADPRVLPPGEAEVLRRAAKAEASRYAEEKEALLAKAETLHLAVEDALERAEKELKENNSEAEAAIAAKAKQKR